MKWPFKYLFLVLFFQSCHPAYKVKETESTRYDLKQQKNDSLAALTISPYKEKLDSEMKTVIAYSDSSLTREGFEPKVGNFMLQAMEHYMLSHHPQQHSNSVLIVNRGGLRNDLPQGNITKGNIFELMPFDNEIVILTLKGDKLKECADAIATYKKLLAFGIECSIKESKAENISVLNQPLDLAKEYLVVTTDYLANGGDNCSFFAKPVKHEITGTKLRDAILSYCDFLTANKRHIKPFTNGKIRISQ